MDAGGFGHFDLLQKIGEGGMGVVYKARDSRLERVVAIKLLPESRAADAERRARFIHEAKAASALNHPNIVTIHEAGEQDGRTFMVMEFVDGKPLGDLIPNKGMRLTEALRVAVQVADALTAAHAAGIVHRDLKPANIMVDGHGRVKVLDFGLAKQVARAVAAEDETRTVDVALTEEGTILGSVPYMSPEQAEGKPVDARSDIFSFGTVLYEMITGQRAFRGETRISTLAAVVEKEPQLPSQTGADAPPDVERLIARCMRKDVNRRSQHMADVKLALEELRDESESGKLVRPSAPLPATAAGHRWLLPSVALACVAVGAVLAWALLHHRGPAPFQAPELTSVSPDDGHSYRSPSISLDGKFVVYVSDRGGNGELWLQQIGGGNPIQLTHSADPVDSGKFFPDGTRILYATRHDSSPQSSSIQTIPTLGGEPQVLASAGFLFTTGISPDGRSVLYESFTPSGPRAFVIPASGGTPHELTNFQPFRTGAQPILGWTSDSRWLIEVQPSTGTAADWEWFALPVDGGNPIATGAGAALRAAGLEEADPRVMRGNRVLFSGKKGEQFNVWEIDLTPGSWRVAGVPRQLTFGTEATTASGVSETGTAAVEVSKTSADLYLLPLDPKSGQASGTARRLTQDGRFKFPAAMSGELGSAYFDAPLSGRGVTYALNLETGKQTLVGTRGDEAVNLAAISSDGRQIAYSVRDGDSYSIRVGSPGAGAAAARELCKGCGLPGTFSPDGRFVLYVANPRANFNSPERKMTVRLLEVASGKNKPWLEHPTDSVVAVRFGGNGEWVATGVHPLGSKISKPYLVPWREEPVPVSEWIAAPPVGNDWKYTPAGNFFYFERDSKLVGVRFDPKARSFGQPFDVKFPPGSAAEWKRDDNWVIAGPGLVFTRAENHSGVWLMKLPE